MVKNVFSKQGYGGIAIAFQIHIHRLNNRQIDSVGLKHAKLSLINKRNHIKYIQIVAKSLN